MMVVTVVDLMWIQIGAQNAYALKIWTVRLHYHWLVTVYVTMKPTMQVVSMMVVIAAESVSTQIFALNAYVRKEVNQQMTIHVSFSRY